MLTNLDDITLCRLSQSGDRLAEETLILRHGRLVRRCANPLFLMGGEKDDLIQEGLLGLLSAIRDYCEDGGASFTTYAETCIKNRLSSVITMANRQKHTPLNQAVPMDSAHIEDDVVDPEQLLLQWEEGQELRGVLRDVLSKVEANVLHFYCDGYSYREIAKMMDISTKSVDNAIQRIKKKLKLFK